MFFHRQLLYHVLKALIISKIGLNIVMQKNCKIAKRCGLRPLAALPQAVWGFELTASTQKFILEQHIVAGCT